MAVWVNHTRIVNGQRFWPEPENVNLEPGPGPNLILSPRNRPES